MILNPREKSLNSSPNEISVCDAAVSNGGKVGENDLLNWIELLLARQRSRIQVMEMNGMLTKRSIFLCPCV
ncbi:hypothetical protein DsansV1_C32g0220491 [Dioscorea sansibarensis]